MTLDEYQTKAAETAVYPRNERWGLIYSALGLASEAGEYAGKVKKLVRDHVWSRETSMKELGDVLWYVAACARDMGYTLEEVAQANLDKLGDRKQRGVLGGNGDER
jgi:NTP pyrophosphatase (non-canonical NTP hydrolase)